MAETIAIITMIGSIIGTVSGICVPPLTAIGTRIADSLYAYISKKKNIDDGVTITTNDRMVCTFEHHAPQISSSRN